MKPITKSYMLLLLFFAPFTNCSSQTKDTKAKEEFKKYDVTNSGSLSGTEITACNCKSYDKDGDNIIYLEEFLEGRGINAAPSGKPTTPTNASAISATKKTGDYYSGFNMGMNQTTYYYFLPDNKVVWGCRKGGLEHFDITAENPRNVGTYRKTGNSIAITWQDGSSMSGTLKANGTLDINAGETTKAMPVEKGLFGNYISEIGRSGAAAVETHQFSSNGRFIIDRVVSFDNGDGKWGSETATNKKGSFIIDGFTMTMNFDDGSIKKHTIYTYSTTKNPDHIGWDCEFLTRRK